jgi:D-proline reductase (dithiol) PrdB
MAQFSDMALWLQVYMRAYPYRRSRWSTPAPFPALADAKVALVSTAGMYMADQPAFDASIKSGDCSYRWIPSSAIVEQLKIGHRSKSFDHAGIEADKNLGFPLDRLRELESEKIIGRLNERHLSFMGSITAPGRLMANTAPEAAHALKADGVDIAILVPV